MKQQQLTDVRQHCSLIFLCYSFMLKLVTGAQNFQLGSKLMQLVKYATFSTFWLLVNFKVHYLYLVIKSLHQSSDPVLVFRVQYKHFFNWKTLNMSYLEFFLLADG